MSEHATNERWDDLRRQLSTGVRATVFLMIPSAIGYMTLAPLVVRVLLQHGVTTAASTDLVSDVLRIFVLGLVQFSIFQLFVRAFYALQDSRTPFFANCAVVVCNVALAVPMFERWGVTGIAGAQAIANTLGMLVLGGVMARRLGGLGVGEIAHSVARTCVAAAAAGAILYVGVRAFDGATTSPSFTAQAAAFVGLTVVGTIAFLGVAKLARVPELDYVTGLLRRRVAS